MSDTYPGADLINSDDVRSRIAEIELDIESAARAGYAFDDLDGLLDLAADDVRELYALRALDDVGQRVDGWNHGITIIHESYLPTTVKNDAEELNGIDVSAWPFNRIDWDAATEDVRSDMTIIEYAGETYYTR